MPCSSVVAGAAEPLEWSHGLGGSDGVWDPLFQPTDDTWPQREFGSMLGEVRAYADPPGGTDAENGESEELSKECIALREDVFADVGDILRAGCQPSTEQMSRLMDNPLGNVAMWINQVDMFWLDNDQEDRSPEIQTNYMGILQFPKGITEDWNLINRIVYNIPSVPIDQDAVDALVTTRRPAETSCPSISSRAAPRASGT